MAHAQAIRIHGEGGFLEGGADPRSDGAALGWWARVVEPELVPSEQRIAAPARGRADRAGPASGECR
jgi:hypothetical protein